MINVVDNVLIVRTKLHALIERTMQAGVGTVDDNGEADVAVEWTYENARKLAMLGAPSASPIMRDYKYPKIGGLYNPFEHQEQMAEFLTLHDRGFCFGGMGVGKTAAAIWAAEYLMSIGEVKRCLIICTKSTMSPAWGDTLFMIAPSHAFTLLRGTRSVRERRAQDSMPYHIINHDGLAVCHKQLISNKYDLVIVDESTAFKNPTTKRWKDCNALCAAAKRVWLLTGSPTPKSPEDAYGQAKLVNPNNVPKYATAWKNAVMQQISMYKWKAKWDAKDTVFRALQPAIHIRKEDVLKNQPATTRIFREVEPSEEQTKLLKALKNQERIVTSGGGTVTPVHAAAALTKYMQIMLGAVYDDDGVPTTVDAESRMTEVVELIEEGRSQGIGDWDSPMGKAIVAVPYRHVLETYEKFITSKGYKVGVIHGGVSGTARDTIVRKFQTTQDIDVLLAVPDAIAHGLTLTAANTFIWCSPMVKPEIFQQANERMDRPGQKQLMTQARIYASKIERQYYSVMEDRENWQNGLLGMYNELVYSV